VSVFAERVDAGTRLRFGTPLTVRSGQRIVLTARPW
jgi:hypothetical protein